MFSYRFVPMNEAYAREIVARWAYPPPYDIYDYAHEAGWINDRSAWGDGLWAVLDEAGELCGELSAQFLDERMDTIERPPGSGAPAGGLLWLGWGLRPELTGRGLGLAFVLACVDFAVAHYRYQGEYVGLGVAAFNQRARIVYERAGFVAFRTVQGKIAGRPLQAVWMRKRLRQA